MKDVPESIGAKYPEKKKKVFDLVPPGGYWKDLPDDVAKDYMKSCYFMGGGRTGIARRLSWDEPSLTLTCSPMMKLFLHYLLKLLNYFYPSLNYIFYDSGYTIRH